MVGWKTLTVAYLAFHKHRDLHPLANATGMLSLHAYARLALAAGSAAMLTECRHLLMPFVRGETSVGGNFAAYECGGSAAALLFWKGHLPEAEAPVRAWAEALLAEAPRDARGIFSTPRRMATQQISIDTAVAVVPFLVDAGLALGEDRYVQEGFEQMQKLYEALRDPVHGLLHQCRGVVATNAVSEDHWSRGNGGALLALSELLRALPADDPRRPAAQAVFAELAGACLEVQDEVGLWHQELTEPLSYIETSGSGLMLYALGVGLAQGLLPAEIRPRYELGLRSYLDYIRSDGSVYHTCRGCFCPGRGTAVDYMAQAPVLNDPHAFAPVTLAYGQAYALGIEALDPGHGRGSRPLSDDCPAA